MTWLRKLADKFMNDALWQEKFHKRMTVFWLCNMVGVTLVFILAPGLWKSASILYLMLTNLYANAATDYGAVSAAEASVEAHILSHHA